MYNEHTNTTASRSPQLNEWATAMAKAQAELKNPSLDSVNPHFRNSYASLAGILASVRPVLAKHGLCLTQHLAGTGEGISCTTIVVHASGQFLESTLTLPATKRDPQGLGSVSTYARRYAVQAVLGISGDDDDDGEAASQAPATRANQSRPLAGNAATARPAPAEPDPLAAEIEAALASIRECPDLDALNGMTAVLRELSEAGIDARTKLGAAFVARKKELTEAAHG